MRSISILLLCAFILFANAQIGCSMYNQNCLACAAQPGCGFCYTNQQCLDSDNNGPVTGHCYIGWFTNTAQCPNCTAYTNCGDCNSSPYCGWCNSGKNCVLTASATTNNTCLLSHSCDCRKYLNCYGCSQEPGCGWCPERQTCEDMRHTTCTKFAMVCPACNTYKDCESCVPQADCAWCVGATQQCLPNQNCSTSSRTTTCSSICAKLNGCDPCTRQAGCAWCEKKQKCVGFDSKDASCTLLSHSCPNQRAGFSGASFVGGMFLVIGIGLLVGAGFFAFRYFQKRQSNYTEV
jgi:hypothetical protein